MVGIPLGLAFGVLEICDVHLGELVVTAIALAASLLVYPFLYFMDRRERANSSLDTRNSFEGNNRRQPL